MRLIKPIIDSLPSTTFTHAQLAYTSVLSQADDLQPRQSRGYSQMDLLARQISTQTSASPTKTVSASSSPTSSIDTDDVEEYIIPLPPGFSPYKPPMMEHETPLPWSGVSSSHTSTAEPQLQTGSASASATATSTSLSTRGSATASQATSSPTTSTTDIPALSTMSPSASKEPASESKESKTAAYAIISIIALLLLISICYCLLRYCTPIRNRITTWKDSRRRDRAKRLGLQDCEAPAVAGTGTTIAAFLASNHPDVEEDYLQHPAPAYTLAAPGHANGHINALAANPPTPRASTPNSSTTVSVAARRASPPSRPPSYRSNWTASGASWVANGFRPPTRTSGLGTGMGMRMARLSAIERGRENSVRSSSSSS